VLFVRSDPRKSRAGLSSNKPGTTALRIGFAAPSGALDGRLLLCSSHGALRGFFDKAGEIPKENVCIELGFRVFNGLTPLIPGGFQRNLGCERPGTNYGKGTSLRTKRLIDRL
jgi:hypothetical protein